MDKVMEQALIECLDALDRGEPIGEILSRYPDQAEELRPILETTARLGMLNLNPTVAAQTKSRQDFLAQAEMMRAGSVKRGRRPLLPLLLRPLAAIAILFIMSIGFVNMSAQALPGDVLYGAKLFFENAQLSLSGQADDLVERHRQNRILEIEALLAQNREANVAFRGLIDGVEDDIWRIEGLLVAVAAAEKQGHPQKGDLVDVAGWVANGRLVASTVTVIQKNENSPTPIPTTAPTQTATPESTVTAVSTTPTPSSSPIPTTPSTLTSTSTPTATARATGTATTDNVPVPPATDDHDDGDDNSGSGSDDDNSGSGSGSDDNDDNSGNGSDDNSGSGSSNSGSGSNNSGSGSDDDSDDNSGSGSGSDDEDNSGSGSSNSGSGSGSDDERDSEEDNE